jgi:hypothetical protein
MKRFTLLAAGALLVLPAPAIAQNHDTEIERALAAAPSRSRDDATVVHWNDDYTYETIKEGSNNIVCFDRSSGTGFSVQCTSLANLDRVAQNRRFRDEGADRAAVNAMIAEAEANGTRADVEYGSMWIAMRGDDMESAGIHRTIAVPGATSESTGMPDNGRHGGAFIMGGGTAGAHIMIPGG